MFCKPFKRVGAASAEPTVEEQATHSKLLMSSLQQLYNAASAGAQQKLKREEPDANTNGND